MMESARSEITQLLNQSRGGNKAAFDALIPVVYRQLYQLASKKLSSERRGHTLRTTEIVHEAYLRLVDSEVEWSDRAHFFAVSAQVMRRILVDHARSRNREKRGGEYEKVPLDEAWFVGVPTQSNLLEVNQALERLSATDERKGSIVELLIFGGLTYEEAAKTLGISEATLHRELRLARAFLNRELHAPPPSRSQAGSGAAG